MNMKEEFKRRLVKLQVAIEEALSTNSLDRGLMPALFSVFTYLWTDYNAKKKVFGK